MKSMHPITFKMNTSFCYMDKDVLHNEVLKYGFIDYIGKSKIDGYHMYKLNRYDVIDCRIHKINKIYKKMGKPLICEYLNKDLGSDKEADKFIVKYRQYIELISTLEDHIPNFNYPKIVHHL